MCVLCPFNHKDPVKYTSKYLNCIVIIVAIKEWVLFPSLRLPVNADRMSFHNLTTANHTWLNNVVFSFNLVLWKIY